MSQGISFLIPLNTRETFLKSYYKDNLSIFRSQNIEEMKQQDKPTVDEKKNHSMIQRIIKTGYKALDLVYFFTAGEDEVRAWTIKAGTKAPQAAGVIHTDFEKGFICAEIMKCEDLFALKNVATVKAEGKYRQQGKEHIVEDGDICFFKFNTGGGHKK